jgi:hypothetical protein
MIYPAEIIHILQRNLSGRHEEEEGGYEAGSSWMFDD